MGLGDVVFTLPFKSRKNSAEAMVAFSRQRALTRGGRDASQRGVSDESIGTRAKENVVEEFYKRRFVMCFVSQVSS